jgi:AcrR family transcriptional regulator
MRANAQRNYDRILAAAEDVFSEHGTEASLNQIAKRAGVGPGTLYRHFPDREALLDVLMKDWVDRIQTAADKAVASGLPPRDLLVSWFEDLVGHISVHHGGPGRITAALGKSGTPITDKAGGVVNACATVLRNLDEQGMLREGVEPVQVCRLVGGIAATADNAQLDEETTRQLLETIADGLLLL